MRNAFAQYLLEKALKDKQILLITGDLGFGVLDDFAKELPNQFINAGIAEQSMMSMAAGLASRGFRPFVYSIANFPTFRCLEQIRNDVTYMNNPVTIVSVGAGLSYGSHGYTHHAVEDIAIMRALSNMRIFSPSDAIEARESVDSILRELEPAYLRLGKGGEKIISGILRGSGSLQNNRTQKTSGIICWTGAIGVKVHEAVDLLESQNIIAELISVPEMSDLIFQNILEKSNGAPILTVEEHVVRGGFGSWLLEVASDKDFKNPISRLGVSRSTNHKIGSQDYLLVESALTPVNIANSFKKLINHRAASGI